MEKDNYDAQNDFIVHALYKHMNIMRAVNCACRNETMKFYRGEESNVKECRRLNCDSSNIEQKIVSYVSKIFNLVVIYIYAFSLLVMGVDVRKMVNAVAIISHQK